MSKFKIGSLEDKIISEKLLSEDQVVDYVKDAEVKGVSFFDYLIAKGIINERKLAEIVANYYSKPLYNWDDFFEENIPKDDISDKFIIDNKILPVDAHTDALNQTIVRIVVAYPSSSILEAIDREKFNNPHLTMELYIGEASKILDLIDYNFGAFSSGASVSNEDLLNSIKQDSVAINDAPVDQYENTGDSDDSNQNTKDYVKNILKEAIRLKASDIHFEPHEFSYNIRMRIDGVLRLHHSFRESPKLVEKRFVSLLKIFAGLDISKKQIPQDGRYRLPISLRKSMDFRVSTLPSVHGEKIVLRILDPSSTKIGIDALGYEQEQKEMFMEAINKPQGMVLITGPTGSGKTVSLYTALNFLNTIDRNIATAEDPVEINLDGITQVNVNPKTDLTFANVLRAFLRQDPDIIMVGEIRDLETAEIAIKASQTGHMVLSTLHTNSAPETLTRLRNMGIPSFNIATSINLVIAQRLARCLCVHCKKPVTYSEKVLTDIGFTQEQINNPDLEIYEAVGCDRCSNGYKGRIGVFEVVKVTPEISHIIMHDGNALEITKKARELGFYGLRQAAILKVLKGQLDLKEVMRVTNDV